MARKVNKDYLQNYTKVIMTQPLPKGNKLFMTFNLNDDKEWWTASYSTNRECVYHVCPYDGQFRNCKDCGALDDDFDVKFCLKKQQVYSPGAVCTRINDCIKAGLNVQFID